VDTKKFQNNIIVGIMYILTLGYHKDTGFRVGGVAGVKPPQRG